MSQSKQHRLRRQSWRVCMWFFEGCRCPHCECSNTIRFVASLLFNSNIQFTYTPNRVLCLRSLQPSPEMIDISDISLVSFQIFEYVISTLLVCFASPPFSTLACLSLSTYLKKKVFKNCLTFRLTLPLVIIHRHSDRGDEERKKCYYSRALEEMVRSRWWWCRGKRRKIEDS